MAAQEQTSIGRGSLSCCGRWGHGQKAGVGRITWRQYLLGPAHCRSKAVRSRNDVLDQRAAEQREGTGTHGRAGVVLAGGDHGDSNAFVAAKAIAIYR